MFSIEIDITERDVDTEQGYFHVHHADSIKLLELARRRYLEHLGAPNESFVASGLLPVVSALKVCYRREVKQGEVRVTCENSRFEGKKLIVEQKLYNERGKLAIEAIVEVMFMSAQTRRAVAPPPEFIDRIMRDVTEEPMLG